jgi:hypothetical protein
VTPLPHVAAARPTAQQTFTDTCTISRVPEPDDSWDPDDGLPDDVPVAFWTGPCSLSAPPRGTGVRSDAHADDRILLSEVLRVPFPEDCPAGPVVHPGDLVVVASQPDRTLVVLTEARRTNTVLRRIRVVDQDQVQGVPAP